MDYREDILNIFLNREVQPYIICAAIHFKDGTKHEHQPKGVQEGIVVCGRRHHNCFATYARTKCKEDDLKLGKVKTIQGFLTSDDRFVDRIEGSEIAFKAGQIPEKITTLFSEDLY